MFIFVCMCVHAKAPQQWPCEPDHILVISYAWINHVDDVVNGETGLGNVGGEDDLPRAGRRGLEYLGLQTGFPAL